ncbi:hypothetical protein PVAND_004144 [Polypedilum vanderplanki]|uniref:CUB domain-containing protein n=1 Tax=Polypedilum vanderplanki TaxID=319348 RepID=A0A9J6BWT5_POLVA|nr:hypothetical protein PVAND_004144 [Polypedilum vanderplanki]
MYKALTLLFLTTIDCQSNDCNFYNLIQPNENFEIYSNGYKKGSSAEKNVNCRYAIETSPGYKISTLCRFSFFFPLPKCQSSLQISRRGRVDLQDAQTFCGWLGKISTTSLNNRMTIEFKTGSIFDSKFLCKLKLIEDEC